MKTLSPQNANVREIPVRTEKLAFESFTSNAVLGPEAMNLDEVTIGRAVRGDKQGDSSNLPHLYCLSRSASR